MTTYKSLIFKHLVPFLDVSTWPTDARQFGEDHIQEIAKYFSETLIYNIFQIEDLQREWTVLKTIVKPIHENDTKAYFFCQNIPELILREAHFSVTLP